jgi:hypothetical protein
MKGSYTAHVVFFWLVIRILGTGLCASAHPASGIAITASCASAPANWGEPAVISGTVTNTGKTTITDIVITDSLTVGQGVVATVTSLSPGQELPFSGSFTAVPSNTCSIGHYLTAIGTSRHGDNVTNFASTTCTVVPHTRLDMTFECPDISPHQGERFSFSATITNRGDYLVTSSLIYVYQAGSNVLTMPGPLLYPGEGARISGSYAIPTNVPAALFITNTLTMIGYSYCGAPASNTITQVCPLQVAPPQLQYLFREGNLVLSWPSFPSGFVLQQNSDVPSSNWVDVTNTPVVSSNFIQVTVSPDRALGSYRLRLP